MVVVTVLRPALHIKTRVEQFDFHREIAALLHLKHKPALPMARYSSPEMSNKDLINRIILFN